MKNISKIDEEYFKSGRWRCNNSPTGGHHWVQMMETEKLFNGNYYRCKYCLDVKRFPTYAEVTRAIYGKPSRHTIQEDD